MLSSVLSLDLVAPHVHIAPSNFFFRFIVQLFSTSTSAQIHVLQCGIYHRMQWFIIISSSVVVLNFGGACASSLSELFAFFLTKPFVSLCSFLSTVSTNAMQEIWRFPTGIFLLHTLSCTFRNTHFCPCGVITRFEVVYQGFSRFAKEVCSKHQ